jgi:membrane protease YdiL (CAAX protease family)
VESAEITEIPGAAGEPAALPAAAPRWHPLVRSILFVVAFLAAQVAASGLLYLAVWALGLEAVSADLDVQAEILLGTFALTALLLVPVTRLFLRRLDRRGFASLGFRPPRGGRRRTVRQSWQVPLATLGLLALWTGAAAWLGHFQGLGLSPEVQRGPAAAALILPLFLLGFLVQGGVEEWVLRGYVLAALRERWGFPVSGLVSSAIFGALHGANPDASATGIFNTFLAGFLLAELVERSGSLYPAVLAHGVWNFAIGCLASLPISGLAVFKLLSVRLQGPAWVTGGGYGPEASLVLTLLALPLVPVLWPRAETAPTRTG